MWSIIYYALYSEKQTSKIILKKKRNWEILRIQGKENKNVYIGVHLEYFSFTREVYLKEVLGNFEEVTGAGGFLHLIARTSHIPSSYPKCDPLFNGSLAAPEFWCSSPYNPTINERLLTSMGLIKPLFVHEHLVMQTSKASLPLYWKRECPIVRGWPQRRV